MSTLPSSVGFRSAPETWLGRLEQALGPRGVSIAIVLLLAAVGVLWGAAIAVAGAAAALICVSILGCIFCLRDFRFGVVVLILIMPISSSAIFPHDMFGIGGLNPLNLLLFATFGSYLLAFIGKGAFRGFAPRPLWLLYVAPIVFGAWLGMRHVGEIPPIFKDMNWIDYNNATGYWRDLVVKPFFLVLFALLVGAGVVRSKAPERFLNAMVVSMWVMGMLVIFYTVSAHVSLSQLAGVYDRSFFSPLGLHANDLGRLYATAYALLLFIWDRTSRPALKTLLILSMGVVAIALLLTFSRGAFFGFAVVNVIYLFSRRKLKTILLGLMIVPVGLYFAPGAFWDRVTMGMGQGMDAVSAGRTGEIWAPLMPFLMQSPVWGHGLQSVLWSPAMIGGHMLQVTHPHSAYIQAVLDTGAIGLVLLLAFWFGHVWRNFRRLARDPALSPEMGGFFEGAAAGLLAVAVANVAGSSFFPVPEQSFLWLAIGMMYGMRQRLRAAEG